MENLSYEFEFNGVNNDNIIKVIGVGGGGSNAVNYMFSQGITGVDFFVCNTDKQALQASPVPNKVQIGDQLTAGLGAGAKPEVGRNAAYESKEVLRNMLSDNTKMVFITAGMGGGTGTGAAPVIAEISRELGILTVGIVTRPFAFEGKPKARRAEEGIEELKRHCDTVLVILNDKLREVYGKASLRDAFSQADNVLTNAAKSIAEIITVAGNINVDFEDVRTVMSDSGAAVMGSALASGDERARQAAEGAIKSPLLNNTNIYGASYILLSIAMSSDENFEMSELEEISEFVQEQAGDEAEVIFGTAIDASLDDAIRVTVIATGFDDEEDMTFQRQVIDLESNKRIKPAISSGKSKTDFFDQKEAAAPRNRPSAAADEKVVFQLEGDYEIVEKETDEERKKKLEDSYRLRKEKLEQLKSVRDLSSEELRERQDMPAYLRKGIKLSDVKPASEDEISRYNLNENNDLLGNNRFLHDNVD